MKPTNQQPRPAARDFTQPLAVRGSELAQAIAEARAAGYTTHQMRVLPDVVYEIAFFKSGKPATTN